MSIYLARLKQIENEKNFHDSPKSEVSKVSEVPFGTFDTSNSEENKKISDVRSPQIEQVCQWLFKIGESPEDHDIVLNKCRNDSEGLKYFRKHARGEFDP